MSIAIFWITCSSAAHLDSDGRADARGEHVEPRLDGHGPRVADAGQLKGGVHLGDEFLLGDAVAPERPQRVLSHSGAHVEYQRGFSRHCDSGLSRIVVSIMENGAGSVGVSARPALPKTRATSGKVIRILSCTCSAFCASATDMPGCTADGMYSSEPSRSGGMNSEPSDR